MPCSRAEVGAQVRSEQQLTDEARDRRRRTRTATAGAAVLVVVAAIAAWAVASHWDGNGTAPVDSTAGAHVLVTYDDHGVHASPASAPEGIIQFGFADTRTKRAGEALLYYEEQPNVGGEMISGVGGRIRVLLCGHQWYLVVRVDGAVKARVGFIVTGTSPSCTPSGG